MIPANCDAHLTESLFQTRSGRPAMPMEEGETQPTLTQ
ncbi:DUF6783 domain-containing protein [Blautia sp.]